MPLNVVQSVKHNHAGRDRHLVLDKLALACCRIAAKDFEVLRLCIVLGLICLNFVSFALLCQEHML